MSCIHSLAFICCDRAKKEEAKPDPRLQPTSTYIIPAEPKRDGRKPKMQNKTNAHILVEFGLQVCMNLCFSDNVFS